MGRREGKGSFIRMANFGGGHLSHKGVLWCCVVYLEVKGSLISKVWLSNVENACHGICIYTYRDKGVMQARR